MKGERQMSELDLNEMMIDWRSRHDGVNPDEAGTVDAATERAYKRGFEQAAASVIEALLRGESSGRLVSWLLDIREWRYKDRFAADGRLRVGRVPYECPPKV